MDMSGAFGAMVDDEIVLLIWGISLSSGLIAMGWIALRQYWKKRDGEIKLNAIVEHAAAAMWMSSADGARLLFVNDACEALFGCSKEYLYAQPTSLQRLVHPD